MAAAIHIVLGADCRPGLRLARPPFMVGTGEERLAGPLRGDNPIMIRVVALAAWGFTLAACSSMPSMDIVGSTPPTTTVRLESEPPGAEAKTSLGPACNTPCAVQLPPGDFSVTFSLKGHQPQTIPVRLQPSVDRVDDEVGGVPLAILDPNPVYAELQKAAPTRRAPRRPQTAARPVPAEGQAEESPWPRTR
jgi:hypothetical protein